MKDKDKTKEQLLYELAKLRQRCTELEASETERKQMEEKIIHLNKVLRSIRKVNQLITKEKDRNKFLKGVCNNLIANQGYNNAWVAILGKGDELEFAVEAGLGEDFKPMVKRFEQGKITACGQKALSQSGVVITKDPVFSCKDCPLSSMYRGWGVMTIRLEYEGEVYGFISASVPKGFIKEKEELLLFEEVAGDIAFALYNLELEEKCKQVEEVLNKRTHECSERVKELNCLYGIEKIIRKKGITTEQALEEAVQFIPSSWQYPEITGCRVTFEDKKYKTKNFKETKWKQRADIIVDNKKTGAIEVCYLEEKPEIDEGPFLKEERALINSVCRRLGQFIELKQAEEELIRLSRAMKVSTDSVVISDINAKIIDVNEATLKMYGTHDKEDLIGKNSFDLIVPEDREYALEGMKKVLQKGYTKSREYNIITKDGDGTPVEMSVSTINDKDGKPIGFVGISRDITERKKAEEQIKASLKEKEVMLQEIHHRVKNNMQIMSSLLKLQFAKTKSKKLQEMLKISQNRIHSMALIHERLYQSKDFARIDFAYYIRSLTVYLFHSYRVNTNIVRLKTDVRDVHLDINRAIPCGLIVNELVSNSLKHAFPGGREGEISIKFYSNKQGKITLVVSDNGVGFPEDIDFRSTESFGMQVVNDLIEQLRGTIKLDRKGGTTFKVKF